MNDIKNLLIKFYKNKLRMVKFAEKYSNDECCGLLHRYFDFEGLENDLKETIERIKNYGK